MKHIAFSFYQCGDYQLEGRTLQRGRGYLLPDESGEGKGNGIYAL